MQSAEAATQRMTRVRELDLEVREAGTGADALYLHPGRGFIGSEAFVDALSRHMRVVAPSHPGFGASALPDWMSTVEDLAYHYLDVIEALDLRDATLIGSSFGGWIAASIAIKRSPRIARVVLMDPVGLKVGGREDRDIVDIWGRTSQELLELGFHDPAKGRIDYASLPEATVLELSRNRESEAWFGWSPYMHDPKLKNRLHRIDRPTLVLWGASDRIVTPDYGRAYAAAIPGAELQTIAQAGHLPQVEQPEACAAAIREFIAATPAAPRS
ncbi:MAG TPA: alpha/beta hydrolase [Beijerinckiaceae bacterium]